MRAIIPIEIASLSITTATTEINFAAKTIIFLQTL